MFIGDIIKHDPEEWVRLDEIPTSTAEGWIKMALGTGHKISIEDLLGKEDVCVIVEHFGDKTIAIKKENKALCAVIERR